ncbi:MAG TPA: hypothetical protein VFS64_03885 [Solirubrobacterales bacterium]|nr:hypothetical protein [Solirubrobacterales bacterium]
MAAATCATAYAITIEVGPVWVSATATAQPRVLPKPGHGNVPITLTSITRVGTHDGSTPPTLKSLQFVLDRNGTIDTRGLPTCSVAKLEGTTPGQARKACGGALVGTGTAKVLVTMPGRAPFSFVSPLSFFNGPRPNGAPTLIAHGYETVPAPKTLLVPIAIERISGGRYGYRVDVEMPEFADGYGAPLLAEAKIGATRKRGGRTVGYLNAHCAGGRLQVHGTARFTNGDSFPVTLTSPCHSPG